MGEHASMSSQSNVSSVDSWADLEWVAADALLNANLRTTQILEQYMLQQYHLDGGVDYERLDSQIRDTIEEHERIIEDLEAARLALGRAKD